MFSCETWNTYFEEHLRTTAFDKAYGTLGQAHGVFSKILNFQYSRISCYELLNVSRGKLVFLHERHSKTYLQKYFIWKTKSSSIFIHVCNLGVTYLFYLLFFSIFTMVSHFLRNFDFKLRFNVDDKVYFLALLQEKYILSP